MPVVSPETLGRQLKIIFESWGIPSGDADIIVDVMVETDLKAIDSHGVGMLSAYHNWRREGFINVTPQIKVVVERDSLALVDADRALGHLAGHFAMSLAIEKAKKHGTAAVAVTNSGHYGPAGHYAEMAANEGLIGMSFTNASRHVVPTFGIEPMLGTNPIAIAAPAKKNKNFVLDMATSTVALGKLTIAKRAGESIPEGWALDDRGRPITDPIQAIESRRLTPLGGTRKLGSHKGYGLALMVEILCALLSGAAVSCIDLRTKTAGRNIGHFFLAIDPAPLRGEGVFEEEMDLFMEMFRATTPADPAQSVLIPGDPEHAAIRERSKNGIPMTDALFNEVRQVAEESGAAFILESEIS